MYVYGACVLMYQRPLAPTEGRSSFNSGKPVVGGNFLQTFDDPASYIVASQGAPGYSGTVNVLKSNGENS